MGFSQPEFFLLLFFGAFSSSPTTDATQREGGGESEPKKMFEATVNIFSVHLFYLHNESEYGGC